MIRDSHRANGKAANVADNLALLTGDELLALPPRAMIAFAARCARRVQPLCERHWPNFTQIEARLVERAIRSAEEAAMFGPGSAADAAAAFQIAHTLGRASQNAIAAAAASAAASAAFPTDDAGGAARVAIAASARAGAALLEAIAASVASAVASAAQAFVAADYANAGSLAKAAMRYDYELLRVAASVEGWTDATPVPAEFFGALWPFGVPDGWPEDRGEKALPSFRVRIDPGTSTARELADLLDALSDLHRAHGGSGLALDDEMNVYAAERERV